MNLNENSSITCETLNELVTALSKGERATFNHIIRSMEVPVSAFENHSFWSNETYTRNCIFKNEKFELILLCWEKGQMTPIHDHGGEECWVRIIEGELRENLYQLNENGEINTVRSTVAKKDDITYMIDFMGFHSLENLSNKRSRSLHLYAKPIRNCNVFDENSKQFINKYLVYNTISEHL